MPSAGVHLARRILRASIQQFTCNICTGGNDMLSPLDGRPYYAILIILATFLLAPHSAYAFDPATDHTCVAYCGGGSAPSSGGGYVTPAPSGPSPAELARRRQHAAGIAANNRGIAALNRPLKRSHD